MVSNLYLNVDAKTATLRIQIGGTLLTQVINADWTFAYQRPPTALIRVPNPAPASAVYGAAVTIDSGWNGLTTRCFTGTVLNINPDEAGCTIECQGKSAVLENTFHKIVVSVDGSKTATQLVIELLVAAGATDYSVNLPAWTPGTVCPKDLEFTTYSEAITKIAEVDGGQWWETPTGTIRVAVVDPYPSGSAWRTYFSGVLTGTTEGYPPGIASGRPRLRHIAQAQQTRDVKNQAWVRGCTYDQTNPDGTKVAIDVEGTALAGSPWVRMPDGSQGYNDLLFSNELIDTPVKAGTVAARLVTYYNRLLTEISATVDGDPEIALGATVRIEDPSYSRTTGNWFVGGYHTRIDDTAFVTDLTTLLGGADSGYTVNICPFALFTYWTDLEVMGDRPWAIITLDGCASVDPDGSIVLWEWSDDQGQLTAMSGTDCAVTTRLDPTAITGTWNVTLRVTDDDGCTDEITLPVAVEEGFSAVRVPAVFVAFDAWFSASPDGGVTWYDQAAPTGMSVISVSAKPEDGLHYGYGVYGLSGTAGAGAIYRTEDYCATAPYPVLTGLDSPVVHCWWDLNHPTDVWAITWDGDLWRSQDDGAAGSWALYKDLNTLPWLNPGEYVHPNRIATPAPNGVWIFGGQYIDWAEVGCLVGWPLVCWDANLTNSWAIAQVGGELLDDLNAWGGCSGTSSYMAAIGSYVGNSLAGHAITGLGFQPEVVIICRSGQSAFVKGANAAFGTGSQEWDGGWSPSSSIYSLDADGFTLGNNGAVNGNGLTHYYVALRGGIVSGKYLAPGGAGGSVVGVGFTPAMVWGFAEGTRNGVVKTPTMADPKSCRQASDVLSSAEILSIDADGFTYGNGDTMNDGPGVPVYWIAFPSTFPFILGSYLGDGTDDRPILAGDYGYAVVMGDVGKYKVHHPASMAGDVSHEISNGGATAANLIQSLSPFQVGSDDRVNKAGITYYYILVPPAGGGGGGGGAGGPTDLFVHEAASREAKELAIILDSAAWLTGVYYTRNIFGDGSDWLRASDLPAKSRGRWIAPDYMVGKFAFAYNDAVVYLGDVDPVTDRMAVTVAPAHLDTGPSGTDESNYGQWLGAFNWWMPGVYLVAAEGPNMPGLVYKSWDRFASIDKFRPAAGFEACHAGSKGKMFSLVGGGGSGIIGGGRVHMLVQDGAGADRRLVKLDAGSWSTVATGLTAGFWQLKYWGGGYFTHLVNGGLPRYSGDSGATWSTGAAPAAVLYGPYLECLGIDKAAYSDRLWGIWKDAAGDGPSASVHYCIAYSDDWGATWTLSLEEDTADSGDFRPFWTIACHPADANYIFAAGRRTGDKVAGRYTSDGGAVWTPFANGPADTLSADPPTIAAPMILGLWASAGHRMIVTNQYAAHSQASHSDDYGVTWSPVTIAADVQNPAELVRCGPAGPLFLVYNARVDGALTSVLFRSSDHGDTWAAVGVPAAWSLATACQRAIRYSLADGWLYLARNCADTVYSFEDVAAGGAGDWTSREYDLDSIGAGMTTPQVQGVDIVWD